MSKDSTPAAKAVAKPKSTAAEIRLAEALRANLLKRKAQSRQRRAAAPSRGADPAKAR
ncbi:MAG: hypothetical protein SFV19_16800 [Rhodospirillaceae bacterium]|nr:hypothetical protein [Rhodospirillaceae bacterium]